MATIRRDIAPGKDKKVVSITPQTGTTTTKLRGTPNYPSKTNSIAKPTPSSTAPQKHAPNYLRPTRTSNINVPKQLGKKPASTVSVQKPTVGRIRSSDKTTLSTTQKTRVSTNVSHGSFSVSGKTSVSQKLVPSKNVKAPVKDVGKRSSLYGRSVSTVKKSSIKKKETENSTALAAKERQISNVHHEKVENSNTSVEPQPQPQHEDQESCIPEAEEQIVQAVNNSEKGTDDLVLENQESSNIGQIESESDDKDASKTVIAGDNTVSEHQDAPIGMKTDETVDKLHNERTSIKQEELHEHNMNEVIRGNIDESVADNPNKDDKEDVEEKEVIEVQETTLDKKEHNEVLEVQEIATDNKEEAINGNEVNESKEPELREVVEEKKKEAENVPPRGKKESTVSNDVIEETASKLREQRKNKVRALAGAFETVISLQETK
ncbi:hypothetical protein CDL12_22431 [Handroanthus impetiginosus]|uniref:Calmodulin-binding domain-containing protein n=1 Tax=Handroanthus impetiginosus TaxID=429701 RepID=A0A2G9GIB2_9LAMI|nr:hypothetical protein CDL12_22431 [Handroanthus impetiginosus]